MSIYIVIYIYHTRPCNNPLSTWKATEVRRDSMDRPPVESAPCRAHHFHLGTCHILGVFKLPTCIFRLPTLRLPTHKIRLGLLF